MLEPSLAQLAKDPLLPDLLFDYANALMGQEKFEEAAKPFGRVSNEFAQAPQAADAMRLWAFCLHRAKKFQESFELCGKFQAKFAQDKNVGGRFVPRRRESVLARETRRCNRSVPEVPRRVPGQHAC